MAYQLVPLYNLDAGVGRNAPNNRSDVILVESLLLAHFESRSLSFWKDFYRSGGLKVPERMLQAHGKYDTQLQDWIDCFLSTESMATQDGRFDPLSFEQGLLRTHRGGKQCNFYVLMFRAFVSDQTKFLAIGSRQNYDLCIDFPGGKTSRSLCNI